MINFTHHSPESINVAELAAFTHRAYGLLPIPYKHWETPEAVVAFLEQKCPDFIVLARAAGELLGWAGLYLGDWQANLLSWHPLVLPPNPALSEQLVRACIRHTAAAGHRRMEVLLLNLTSESRDYAAQCGVIYQAAGMGRGSEWQSMEAGLQQRDPTLRWMRGRRRWQQRLRRNVPQRPPFWPPTGTLERSRPQKPPPHVRASPVTLRSPARLCRLLRRRRSRAGSSPIRPTACG